MFSINGILVITSVLTVLAQSYTQRVMMSSFLIALLPLYLVALFSCYLAYRYFIGKQKKSKS